jgi:hypothetical protein
MDQSANSSPENKRYNDEIVLLDGLYEFHPELLESLDKHELLALETYYLTGQDVPENVFEYRTKLAKSNPKLEEEAHAAFNKICQRAGIE